MFGLSFGEILFLGVLALIVVGPKQLPELARYLGRFLNEVKRSTEELTGDLKRQARADFDWENMGKPKTPEAPAEPVHGNPPLETRGPLDQQSNMLPPRPAQPHGPPPEPATNTTATAVAGAPGDKENKS